MSFPTVQAYIKIRKEYCVELQPGVSGYVVRPVDFSELIKAVKEPGNFLTLIDEPPPNSCKASR